MSQEISIYGYIDKEFTYEPGEHAAEVSYNRATLDIETIDFDYRKFAYPFLNPKVDFYGECSDIASFYVLCCSVVGVNANRVICIGDPTPNTTNTYITNLINPAGTTCLWQDPFGPPNQEPIYVPSAYRNWKFKYHIIPSDIYNNLTDPLLYFAYPFPSGAQAIATDRTVYYNALVMSGSPHFQSTLRPGSVKSVRIK
jgi:hypothetical protein